MYNIENKEVIFLSIDLENLDKYITSEKFIGDGSHAKVYNIDDDFVLRIAHEISEIKDTKLVEAEDIFDGKNFGQAVLIAEDGLEISINKKVKGHVLHRVSDVLDNPNFDVEGYINDLKKYLQISEQTIKLFIEDILYLHTKGFLVDYFNPENFLYDEQTGKITSIDLRKNKYNLPLNYIMVLNPFVRKGRDILDIYNISTPSQRYEIFELIRAMKDRIKPICENYNIGDYVWNKDLKYCTLETILEVINDIDLNNNSLYNQIMELKYKDSFNINLRTL